jgi:hypothetical protein
MVAGVCLLPLWSADAAVAADSGSLTLPGIGGIVLPEWLGATASKGLENQANAGQQYDLTGLSGDAWRYARIVVYRLEQNMGPAALLFGLVEANPTALGELARPLLEKSLAENGGKILEWSPARKTSLGGRSVPTISARLTMTEKVPLPMAATVYVFMHKERLYALGYFVPDSDRRFWEKIATPMLGQLQWE